MDIASALAGGALSFLGLAAGMVVEKRRERRRQTLDSLKPICTCKHYKNMHKNGSGRCNERIKLKGTASSFSRWEDCPCLHYLGPTPIEELMAQSVNPRTEA